MRNSFIRQKCTSCEAYYGRGGYLYFKTFIKKFMLKIYKEFNKRTYNYSTKKLTRSDQSGQVDYFP